MRVMFLGSGVWGMRGMDGDEVGSEEVRWDGMNDGIGRWCGVFSKRKEKMIEGKGICLCVCVLTDRLIDRQTGNGSKPNGRERIDGGFGS